MGNGYIKVRRTKTIPSSYHLKVGKLLRQLGNYRIFEEYPVYKINPYYRNHRHMFDYVILDLHLVVEIHGQFHYQVIQIQDITTEQAIENLHDQKFRDKIKKDAAIEAGFTYIAIHYKDVDTLTPQDIVKMYRDNMNDIEIIEDPKKVKRRQLYQYIKQRRTGDENS